MARFLSLLFVWLVFVNGLESGHDRQANVGEPVMINTVPLIAGETYECGQMVQVVNHLRSLGKDKALAALRGYLASSKEHDKVLIICRLLFVNPKGWVPPNLGKPVPAINADAAKNFPLFPIALSDRVPFLLVVGYRLDGLGESAIPCLEQCEGFALVKEDYSLVAYEKAAQALTQTDSFRDLYQKADRQEMANMILRQAKTTKGQKKK